MKENRNVDFIDELRIRLNDPSSWVVKERAFVAGDYVFQRRNTPDYEELLTSVSEALQSKANMDTRGDVRAAMISGLARAGGLSNSEYIKTVSSTDNDQHVRIRALHELMDNIIRLDMTQEDMNSFISTRSEEDEFPYVRHTARCIKFYLEQNEK